MTDPLTDPVTDPVTDVASLQALSLAAQGCPACRLCETRSKVVFGDGDPTSTLLIVGEAPGGDEDRVGRPFVGRAGQLLDRILAAAGIAREGVYVTNVVKCRPPANRTPESDEIETCQRWLLPQLAALRPKVILTLGNTPTQYFLQTKAGITRIRGTWGNYRHPEANWEAAVMPMFHPAYLLRNDTRAPGGPKSLTWRDIREVKAVLDGEKTPRVASCAAPRPAGSGGLFD